MHTFYTLYTGVNILFPMNRSHIHRYIGNGKYKTVFSKEEQEKCLSEIERMWEVKPQYKEHAYGIYSQVMYDWIKESLTE